MTRRSISAAAALGLCALAPDLVQAFDFAPNDRLTATIADGRFEPRRPGVAAFGAVEGKCPTQAVQAGVADELEQLAKVNGRAVPQTDARLCAAAEAFLAWEAKDPPPPALVAFVLQHFGVLATSHQAVVALIQEEDPRAIAEQVTQLVGNQVLGGRRSRYGVMFQRIRKKMTRVAVVVIDDPPVQFTAPRHLPPGQTGRLAGKLLDDHDKARVFVSDPMGKLTSAEGAADGSFSAELRCGDRQGTIRVEIRAELGGSPVLLGRFPVACGVPLATSAPLAPPPPWAGDQAEQVRRMVEVINAERAAVGVKPLAWDEALAGVASGIADSIRQSVARGAFELPQDLVARLRKAGIASQVVLQNPGQGRSLQDVMEQMAASPGHRASYLDGSINQIGVGVAAASDAQGRPLFVVNQLFIYQIPPVDPAATREKLKAAVVQKRKDGRYPPAAPEASLDEFAQTFAKELAEAGGNLPKARQAELTKALDKQYKSVSVTFGARPEPLDFAEEPEVTAPGKHFGVGVALGMNEKLGRNAIYAVIAVGQERGGKEEAPPASKKGKKK